MTSLPCRLLLPLLFAVGVVAQSPPLRFLQFSDSHLPRPESSDFVREVLARDDGSAVTFGVFTGDITEFGGRKATWPGYLALFDEADMEHYEVLGNHDQTWDGLADRLCERFGAPYYRFEQGGVVFFGLNSASHQDPRPSFGEGQLRWLEAELAKVPGEAPLVLFAHHPFATTEFATPYEVQRLCGLLAGRNVLGVFVGHGHSPRVGRVAAWDQVMGGSTFGGNQGHGDCTVDDGRLRYVYRFGDPAREPRVLLDKMVGAFEPFELSLDVEWQRGQMRARLKPGAGAPKFKEVRAHLDFGGKPVVSGKVGQRLSVPTRGLVPGVHVASFVAELREGGEHYRMHEFEVPSPRKSGLQVVWKLRLPTAVQGPLAVSGDVLAVGGNDGVLRGFAVATGQQAWQRELGGPAPGGVASDSDGGFIAATLGGVVARVDAAGEESWRQELGQAVAATPLVLGDQVVCVDLGGGGHVLDRETGAPRWQRSIAGYAIEKAPVALDGQRIIFGAWDAHIHAVALADGELAWSTPSLGARGKAARYYSPADCSPVVLAGRVFVADRKYDLTVTDLEGKDVSGMKDVASVVAHAPSHAVFLRRTSGKVARLDARSLKVRWEVELPVGRTPTPLTTDGEYVYAIGERDGVLYQLDAGTGQVRARHRVNAGHYPFAPVLLARGLVLVGSMDGRLVALQVSGR